jgi:GDP-mannose 6-dehydrogenase
MISVFGLGYVGCVSVGCLSQRGHRVVGVDVNPAKVDLINAGRSPIVEPGLEVLIARGVEAGRIRATTRCAEAIESSEISLICVGTPSNGAGRLDTKFVERVASEIGSALRAKRASGHTVVVRSTVLPGTTEEIVIPLLATQSGMSPSRDLRVAYNPEFLREGTAVEDFWNPPKTVIGTLNGGGEELDNALYRGLPGPHIVTSIQIGEMVKYVDNAFHALKVAFGNEIGQICAAQGIDVHEVMSIFRQDRKLNISESYLHPGFAYGGSCLPKDLRALISRARDHDLEVPVLSAIPRSNQNLIEDAIREIQDLGLRRVGILGLTFKPDTDDVRESPMVEIAERLLGKGFELAIHDRCFNVARLVGANKAYYEAHLPHIQRFLHSDLETVVDRSEVLVLGTADPEYCRVPEMIAGDQRIVDLAKLIKPAPTPLALAM